MADTAFARGIALNVQKWSAYLFRSALKMIFFGKFLGSEETSIIQTKDDLLKERGDKVTFGLVANLTGRGRVNDQQLEGNEEALTFYDFATEIFLRQNAVKAKGKMTLRRTMFDVRREAKNALANWLKNLIDDDVVMALSGVVNKALLTDENNASSYLAARPPSTNRIFYGGQPHAGTLTAVADDAHITNGSHNHLFGTEVISTCKRMAMMADPIIRPVLVDGEEYYVMFVHPFQAKDLRKDTAWLDAQKYAGDRGKKNPIFTGALGVWDKVVVHEYDRILTRKGLGGTTETEYFDLRSASPDPLPNGVSAARGLLCGAQAGVLAWGQHPAWYEKDFDYNRIPGVATDLIFRADKTTFNSEDYGVIAADTAIELDAWAA